MSRRQFTFNGVGVLGLGEVLFYCLFSFREKVVISPEGGQGL